MTKQEVAVEERYRGDEVEGEERGDGEETTRYVNSSLQSS